MCPASRSQPWFQSQMIQGSSPQKTAQGTGLLPDSGNVEAMT
jgi:hypothetical protein